MRALRLLGPVGAAAILVVGGCSGGPGTDREPTAVEESIIDRMAAPPGEDRSPVETEEARNDLVAECMAEEDLQYLGPGEAPSLIEWLGLTEERFRAAYGFGHTTTIDLAKAYEVFVTAAMEEYQDSFATLPAAERERYQTRVQECFQESYAELGFPENGTVYLPNDSPIHEYTERASEAAADDPRLAEVTDDWSACMGEQGYDFGDRDEMGLPLQEAAASFVTAYASQGQALVDSGRAWEDLRVSDVLDAEQLAELVELQQRELDTAAAHQQCVGSGHDIEAVYAEVYDEHLAEFARSSSS